MIGLMMIQKHVAKAGCIHHWIRIYFLFKHLKKNLKTSIQSYYIYIKPTHNKNKTISPQ